MTNPNTYTQQADRTEICTQETLAVFGDVATTSARFNMAGVEGDGTFVHDVLTDTNYEGFDRVMVVDKTLFDEELYTEISEAGVQQLPLIYSGTEVVAFGVMPGMRPLASEKMHGLHSTGSYIGDKEIMFDAAQKVGRVWSRTGQLINSPIERMGIVSFVDSDDEDFTDKSPLYLCPPYNTVRATYFDEAQGYFIRNTEQLLEQPRTQIPAQRRRVVSDLLEEAVHGFSAGVN